MHYEDGSAAAANSARRKGFLARLARDVRGNTLAIVGAALVPLSAMIGSGVDMSRAYMAQSRLQAACDAAALAGRRIMQNDTLDATVRDEALRFFNFNFHQGTYQTDAFTPTVTRPANGTVRVTASTRIPTTIMSMFGFESLPLNVTCDAALNFVNTDIMLVLDVTGSMDWDINGNFTTSDSQKRITALRDAVMALYDELAPVQTQLEANGLRMRYGIVPYSSTVNVGTLIRDVNPNFLADSVAYQTRVANYTTMDSDSSANGPYWEYYRTAAPYYTGDVSQAASITQGNCLSFMRNENFTGFVRMNPTTTGGPAPATTYSTTFPHDGVATSGGEWGWSGAPDTEGTSRSCRRRRTDTTTTYDFEYTNDTFAQRTLDTSAYKMGTAVPVAMDSDITGSDANDDNPYTGQVAVSGSYDLLALVAANPGMPTRSEQWNGCIEERRTTSAVGSDSSLTIPALASDLDINGIPNSDETRWRPMWPDIVWRRSSSTSGDGVYGSACPARAQRLQVFNRGQLESYVQSLTPTGNTYHDIGMIWGARMISTGGIFADGCEVFNAMPCTRHLIFMTDGQLQPSTSVYSAYGIEPLDQRITGSPTGAGQFNRHLQRFRIMCNAVQGMNVSVWVIAFGTTLSDDMRECASNDNQASTSSNRDELIARFREIGNQIGALRLTQ